MEMKIVVFMGQDVSLRGETLTDLDLDAFFSFRMRFEGNGKATLSVSTRNVEFEKRKDAELSAEAAALLNSGEILSGVIRTPLKDAVFACRPQEIENGTSYKFQICVIQPYLFNDNA